MHAAPTIPVADGDSHVSPDVSPLPVVAADEGLYATATAPVCYGLLPPPPPIRHPSTSGPHQARSPSPRSSAEPMRMCVWVLAAATEGAGDDAVVHR